jgi:hypothetical protein
MQSGWTLDRDSSDGDQVRITSEGTALHVVTTRRASIYSEPVGLPQPIGRHTASVYLKGKAAGTLALNGLLFYALAVRLTASPPAALAAAALGMFARPILSQLDAGRPAFGSLWMVAGALLALIDLLDRPRVWKGVVWACCWPRRCSPIFRSRCLPRCGRRCMARPACGASAARCSRARAASHWLSQAWSRACRLRWCTSRH